MNDKAKISHCKTCKQPLHQMKLFHGETYPASQCLNRECKQYGKPQTFKRGI